MPGWILRGIEPLPVGSRPGRARRSPARIPLQTTLEEALRALQIRHFERDILRQMRMKELREHFARRPSDPDEDIEPESEAPGGASRKPKKPALRMEILIRNIIWQLYEQIQAGDYPEFYNKRGTIRGLWYHVKQYAHRHKDLRIDFYSTIVKQLSVMVLAGVVSYRDFQFTDVDESKWLLPRENTNGLIVCEKDGFRTYAQEYRDTYGCGAITMGGSPSLMSVDYYTQRLQEMGIDLTQEFTVVTLVDFDPRGEDAANDLVDKLKVFGIRKLHRFRQYEGMYDRLDLIQPKYLFPDGHAGPGQTYVLPQSEWNSAYGRSWFARTKGVNGNMKLGVESDGCRGERIHELLMEHLVPRLRVGVEAVQRRSRMRGLRKVLKDVLIYKQTGVVPDDLIEKPRPPRPPRPT